jgi:flagellar biogenesis protein FliO
MSRHHMTADEFNAFWAMIGAIVLIPSFIIWMLRHLDSQSAKESRRQADIRGRRIDREQRNGR